MSFDCKLSIYNGDFVFKIIKPTLRKKLFLGNLIALVMFDLKNEDPGKEMEKRELRTSLEMFESTSTIIYLNV